MLALFAAISFGLALTPGPMGPAMVSVAARAPAPVALFGWGGGGKKDPPAAARGLSARDADFARRQDKLAARQAVASSAPKGQVEVTFPQKGNKVVLAQQGELIGKVVQRAGMRVKFDCKNGRCGTCQVRLNGRAAAKVCQGATVPSGATRKLTITLDNL